ncbi:hypothetical protein GC175_01150 [bacterium]|nr:hypothetical protein [bacterium]
MNTPLNMKPRTQRGVPVTWWKLAVWLGIAVAVLMAARFAPDTASATVQQSTVPTSPELLTILTGPIDSMNATQWIVAGVSVTVGQETRLNERQQSAGENTWARVEGYPDDAGGLIAVRVKVLPQQPFVRIEGPLQGLEETSLTVSGIVLGRTTTTLVVGSPVVGDRVKVTAAVQTDNTLLALQVRRVGLPGEDDDDDDDVNEAGKIELTGVVIERPENTVVGAWNISGIVVTVNEQTEVRSRVASLIVGAWVKVEGSADGSGGILADELKATDTRRDHKLEGVLDSLSEDEVVISGITLGVADDVKLEDDPTVGEPVEVKARYDETEERLIAYKIEGEDDDDDDHGSSATRHIAGEIKQLPADGLLGEWKVGRKTIVVGAATVIDEHKGLAEEGAQVRVEVLKSHTQPYTAVKVVVLNSAHKDDDDGDDDGEQHRYIEFEGEISGLPAEGLLGEWQVGDKTVIVTEKTQIKGDRDDIALDVKVKVEGYQVEDGKVLARKIKVKDD